MPTVLNVLEADPQYSMLMTLADRVTRASGVDIAAALSASYSGDFTLFAPTNAALMAFAAQLGYDGSNPNAAVNHIVLVVAHIDGEAGLVDLFEGLATGGLVTSDALPDSLAMLEGTVTAEAGVLSDGSALTQDATIVQADVAADNGMIQGVDSLLTTFNTVLNTLDATNKGDTLGGTDGNDMAYLGRGADQMDGGAGADFIFGESGADKLSGGEGDDYLDGGSGADILHGNAGDDTLFGSSGNDLMFGGTGDDMLNGQADNDRLYGGSGSDTLLGDNGNDRLYGDAGADTLSGGAGKDILEGGTGNDVLDGGKGMDVLTGGSGADIFVFGEYSNLDTLTDFSNGEDRLDVSGWGITGFGDLDIAQVDSDAVITFQSGDAVTVQDLNAALLDETDFLFAAPALEVIH
ncbi:Hemolysin, chromosomal [Aquimixticola soesokkakensis]|uniref:Hemolysin, chromosomal n=1 Tax=Aquimixticola soesokkakensis TaxID=1519096 RepID=A0A1Y5TTS2_9RHOB|nr:fasciclin domain-containing protein [Aquimixticola soesokkakensis]SLN68107.1 Hemolysin, chromosomal [Aquimixticola soesokkakensis]